MSAMLISCVLHFCSYYITLPRIASGICEEVVMVTSHRPFPSAKLAVQGPPKAPHNLYTQRTR